MSNGTRRHLVNVFLLVAVLGAAGLMISAVVDAQARIVWQAASLIMGGLLDTVFPLLMNPVLVI